MRIESGNSHLGSEHVNVGVCYKLIKQASEYDQYHYNRQHTNPQYHEEVTENKKHTFETELK